LFEKLYEEYYHDVYIFLLGLTGNESIAEEVTQETFFKAMKKIDGFEGKCDIRVWLCQIAKNTFYSYCRKQKRILPEEQLQNVPASDCSFVERLEDEERMMKIHKVLHNMSEPYKEVFSLRVFGELSFRQIGIIYGKTESWARVTYHRAKQMIVKQMEEE
jgi:RNA polymerase sigma-70 factor (ECF subfamily)